MSFHLFRTGTSALAWARLQPRGCGRLYLIECRELVKIGMTQDVYGRLSVHLNSLPLIRCNFRSVTFSAVIDEYAEVERKLHKLLYRFRIQKESGGFFYEHYDMPPVLVRAVRRYLKDVEEGSVSGHRDFTAFCSLREIIDAEVAPACPAIRFPKAAAPARRRLTVNISRDVSRHSPAVKARMRERRAANFSHFIETLIAEDTGLIIPKLQEVPA